MQTEKRWYGATFPLPNTQPGCKNLVELLNAVNANTAAFSYLYVHLSYVSRTKSLTRYVVYRFCPSGCSCKQNRKAQSMKMPFTQGICYGIFIICMQDRGQPK